MTIASRRSCHTQVRVQIFFTLLIFNPSSAAACLQARWVDGTWESTSCALPSFTDALNHCLAKKDILFLGDSTVRQFIYLLAERWGLQLKHVPCNLLMGHGCFDCERGCRSRQYYNGSRLDWSDMSAVMPGGKMLYFLWKPQVYSLDDIRFLDGMTQRGRRFDAVIVHKGVHAARDWLDLHARKVPEKVYLEEQRVRATLLADALVKHFPEASLIWQDVYHHLKSGEKSAIDDQLREVTTPIFRDRGFAILPGHTVMEDAPKELQGDGIHPEEQVVELLIVLAASIICPAALQEAVLHNVHSHRHLDLADPMQVAD